MEEEAPSSTEEVGERPPVIAEDPEQIEWIIPDTVEADQIQDGALELISARNVSVSIAEDIGPQPSSSFLPASSYFIPESPSSSGAALHITSYPSPPTSAQQAIPNDAPMLDYEAASPQPGPSGLQHFSNRSFANEAGLDAEDNSDHVMEISHMLSPSPSSPPRMVLLPRLEEFPLEPTVTSPLHASLLSWRGSPFFSSPSLNRHHDLATSSLQWNSSRLEHSRTASRFIDQVSSSTGPRHQLNSTAMNIGLDSLLSLAESEREQQILESTVDSTCEDECYEPSPAQSPEGHGSPNSEDEGIVEPDAISSSEPYLDLQLHQGSFAMDPSIDVGENNTQDIEPLASASLPVIEENQRIVAGPSSSSYNVMPVLAAAVSESPLVEEPPVVMPFPDEREQSAQEYLPTTDDPTPHQESLPDIQYMEIVRSAEPESAIVSSEQEEPEDQATGSLSQRDCRSTETETENALPYVQTFSQKFWCAFCGTNYESYCPEHPQLVIQDREVLPRARASLPTAYLMLRERDTPSGSSISVVTRKYLPPGVQFGPVEGLVMQPRDNFSSGIRFLVSDEKGNIQQLNLTDEHTSNWMRFVEPAANLAEQNICLVEKGSSLYFLTTKAITAKQELKVWYSLPYARAHGLPLLTASNPGTFPCSESEQELATAAALQKHLKEHEAPSNTHYEISVGDLNRKRTRKGNRKVQKCRSFAQSWRSVRTLKKRALRRWQKTQLTCEFCSKSFTNSTLLQRHMNSEHQHYSSSSSTTDTKRVFGVNHNEGSLCCQHCRLTFDSVTLLNLHVLAHAAQAAQQQVEGTIATAPSLFLELRQVPGDATDGVKNTESISAIENQDNQCPACPQVFSSRSELITHASAHGRKQNPRLNRSANARRPYKCDLCYGRYATEEKLAKHMAVHCEDDAKPLECSMCAKRFLSQSALTCHQKVHTETKRLLSCPICRQEFEQISGLKQHVTSHMEGGIFRCPSCLKFFKKYAQIRKHIRSFHGETKVFCTVCGKDFTGNDKLKVHMLTHSDVKEFLCSHCGKQFKRRDKLKEHVQRMHSAESEQRKRLRAIKLAEKKKCVPKALPSEYDRFIYKCHLCLVGFKRRGTLVNHLAVRHPEVSPQTIPELNLPILKTIRNYYCQYCNKVYKSSTKRKNHILKHHPGQELPLSGRVKDDEVDLPSNSYYSQTVGSIAAQPHPCAYCHKQYASRAKLLQHHRSKHPDQPSELFNTIPSDESSGGTCNETHAQTDTSGLAASQFQLSDFTVSDSELQAQELENLESMVDNQHGMASRGNKLFYNERQSHNAEQILIQQDPVAQAMQDLQRTLARPHVVPSSPTRSPSSPHFRVGAHYYRLIPLNPPTLETSEEETRTLSFTESASDQPRATLLVTNAANIRVSTAVPLAHHLPGNFSSYKKPGYLEETRGSLEPSEHAHSQLQQLLAVASSENTLAEVNLGNRSWGSVAESYPAR